MDRAVVSGTMFAGVRVPSGVLLYKMENEMKKACIYRRRFLKINMFLCLLWIASIVVVPTASDIVEAGRPATDVEKEEAEQPEVVVGDEECVDPLVPFDYEGTEVLEKDAYPDVTELVKQYYTATLGADMETLDMIVSDSAQIDQSKLIAQGSYIESIDNLICYTVAKPTQDAFRAYVYYDMKLTGIQTPAPALSALYVTLASDGRYIIYLSGLDADSESFITEADQSQDVAHLKDLVNQRFEKVINTDEQLKSFCETMNNG